MREGTEDYELPTESARSAPGRRRGNDASISNLSGRFFETNGGIVDDGPCPEANAEDKPKRNVEKCKAAAQSREVSDAPNDHRHHGSAYDSRTQNAREGTVELRDRIERKRHNNGPHHRSKEAYGGKKKYRKIFVVKKNGRQRSRAPREAQMSTLRLSSILSNNIPTKQPAVNKPQNQETAAAPVVWGSKP